MSAYHQSSLTIDPVDQLLGLRQGDRFIEDYVQQFCELVYQVPLYDETLLLRPSVICLLFLCCLLSLSLSLSLSPLSLSLSLSPLSLSLVSLSLSLSLSSLSLSLSWITFVSRKVVLGVDLMEVVIGSHPCLTRIKGCPKCGSRPSVPLYFSSLISCRSFVRSSDCILLCQFHLSC